MNQEYIQHPKKNETWKKNPKYYLDNSQTQHYIRMQKELMQTRQQQHESW